MMLPDRTVSIIPAMLLLSMMRREAARNALATVADAIAVDAFPTRRKRSRPQHLRNGIAAVLDASSEVAFRPSLFVTLFYATRERVRAELRYGIDEIRRAATPASNRERLLLVAVPSAAAGVALVIRARRHSDGHAPVAPAPSEEPSAVVLVE
jgi:hypothetical protein